MRILLVNPPYRPIAVVHGVGHQTPLGLLSIGGALLDAGHGVELLDAEALDLAPTAIAAHVVEGEFDLVMTGHSGSTPAHPSALATLRAVKAAAPHVTTVYGGVYPTYHAHEILGAESCVDAIVRGEGEATAVALVAAIADRRDWLTVPGITYRRDRVPFDTGPAVAITSLDAWRVGWELVDDWDRYQCFGLGRAAVVQFSRGCPHRCSYCGQYQFWTQWRRRDPVAAVDEIESLNKTHGVRFFDLADENPTSSKRYWRAFLEELGNRALDVRLFATIRATDIVRDADILHLYKRAGMLCVLMGIETTDPATLRAIRKGSTTADDRQAVRLLREHGILSMLGHIVGFEEESLRDYGRALRQILFYDPDLLNAMYMTPHAWADWSRDNAERRVIQEDPAKWDYRHQLLATRRLHPAVVFAAVKLMELIVHLRPRAIGRVLMHRDPVIRKSLRWTLLRSARVFFVEIREFCFATRFARKPRTLASWFGARAAASNAAPLVMPPRKRTASAATMAATSPGTETSTPG